MKSENNNLGNSGNLLSEDVEDMEIESYRPRQKKKNKLVRFKSKKTKTY